MTDKKEEKPPFTWNGKSGGAGHDRDDKGLNPVHSK